MVFEGSSRWVPWFSADLCLPKIGLPLSSSAQLIKMIILKVTEPQILSVQQNVLSWWVIEWYHVCMGVVLIVKKLICIYYKYIYSLCVFMCVYTHVHGSFKPIWSDFSSHCTFSPMHKVKFCLWCWHCAAWPKMCKWRGFTGFTLLPSWLLHETLTHWPGSLNEWSVCLSAVSIHWLQLAAGSAELQSLSPWRNPNTPTDVHPRKSTAVRWAVLVTPISIWASTQRPEVLWEVPPTGIFLRDPGYTHSSSPLKWVSCCI